MLHLLENCTLCPRQCGVNRLAGELGYCRCGANIKVAKAFLHQWEEPCISGVTGSGTVFFSHCNLNCVFCQNYRISQEHLGREITIEQLAQIFLKLQAQGAHNINLVSPTLYVPHIAEALLLAKKAGLSVPVIYNSNGYDSMPALQAISGLVDIYLPDLKYYDDFLAQKYSKAPRYFHFASQAVLEMHRQVGNPVFSSDGLLTQGLIIRHLLLPGFLEQSKQILSWIKQNLPSDVYLSLMAQYTPLYQAACYPELNTKVTASEYETLIDFFFAIGLENGFVQELEAASDEFVPDFDLSGVDPL
ncbi:radical SAM protein [Zhaonella formicivorans]|uniref:radical SAM protein n=1 Tax=Zhaonella formicivorans TaxID=2528593 RepID=UPI0010D8DB11|nr:radical SAM protein [Zhaonella formicivorans]